MSEDQGAIGLVNEKFADSKEYADVAFATANNLLTALAQTAITVQFPEVNTNIPITSYNPQLSSFVYEPAVIVDPDTDVDDIYLREIPDYSGEVPTYIKPQVSSTVIDPVPGVLEDIPVINKPTAPTFAGSLTFSDFDATSLVNQSMSILNALQNNIETVGAVILNFITNPSQAIGDDLVAEMTASAMQKIDDDFAAKRTEVETYFSSRGWNTPQGPAIGRMTELDRAHSLQRAEVQRDVLIKNFELSNQNFIASLQMYIQYVQVNNAAVANTLNTLFGALKYAFESVTLKLQAYIALYQAEIDMYKTDTSVQIQIAIAMIEKNKATIQQYATEVQALTAKIGAISAYNSDLTKQLEAGVTVYGAKVQGITSANADTTRKYAADIQKFTAQTQFAIGQSEVAIKNASNKLAAYDTESKFEVAKAQVAVAGSSLVVEAKKAQVMLTVEKVEADIKNMIAISGLTAEIAKAAAQVAAQLAASSMSAVSAGAQISYHTNANYDETKDIVETRINLSGSVD